MSIAQSLNGVPMQTLQQAVLGNMPNIPPYAALSKIQETLKSQQMQQSMAGQQAMAQNQQQQQEPPIAQQILQQVQGIDTLPTPNMQGFAGGGIVSFDNGGYVDPFGAPDYTTDGSGYGPTMGGLTDVMNVMSGTEAEWQRKTRFARQGIKYDPPEGSKPEGTWEEAPQQAAKFNILGNIADQIRTLEKALNTPGIPKQDKDNITAKLTQLYAQLKAAPVQPTQRPTQPPPAPARPQGIAAALPQQPPVSTASTPTGLDSASADLMGIIQSNAKPDQDIQALQKQYMEAGERMAAEREARNKARADENTGPAGFFSNPQLLGAAAGAARRGGVAGAAEAASKVYGEQQALRRSERDKIDSISDANQQYRQALLEKQIAFRSGDINAQRQADQKVAEAKMNLAKVKMDYQEKALERQKDLEVADMTSGRMLQAAKIRTDGAGGGLDDQFKKEQIALQRLNSDPEYKKLAEMSIAPGAFGERAKARMNEIRSRVYKQLGLDLESDTSAQPGAGASLRYNPATGKIE